MWNHVFRLVPGLMVNRLLHGRFLDIFVTHAPPTGTHEGQDLPHKGINAFRWFNKVFHPRYHIHGHIHVYRPDEIIATEIGRTRILNTFGFLETEINI
jgi:Icc-related predicted phosphoesterase